MKLRALFSKHELTSIKLGTSGISMEITFKDEDREPLGNYILKCSPESSLRLCQMRWEMN